MLYQFPSAIKMLSLALKSNDVTVQTCISGGGGGGGNPRVQPSL